MPAPRYRIDPALPAAATRALRTLLDEAGWTPTTGDDWRLFWGVKAPATAGDDSGTPAAVRFANQLPELEALTWKSRLREHAEAGRQRVAALGGPEAGFAPPVYTLPDELDALKLRAAQSPDTQWIRRPKALSFGEGATLLASPAGLDRDARWLAQEYVADPHLLDGLKYTLRLYLLIASLDPLRLYLHREGRVMLATAPYGDGTDLAASPARYRTTTATPAIDLARYRERLQRDRLDADRLWRRMEWMLAATIAAARDALLGERHDTGSAVARPAGGFALLECDLLVDRSLTPWLLECSAWPEPLRPSAGADLPTSGRLAATLFRDTLALVGVLDEDTGRGTPGARSVPPGAGEDAGARQVEEAAREAARAGGFARLLPNADPARLALIPARRPADVRLARAAAASSAVRPVLTPHDTSHAFLDDGLVLYGGRSRQLYILNPTASFIWLRCAEGVALPDVAAELADVFPASRETVEQDAWTMAADWLAQGLVAAGASRPAAAPPRPGPAAGLVHTRWVWNAHERIYRYLGWRVCLHVPGDVREDALHATLVPFESPAEREYDAAIEVSASTHGYEIRRDGVLVAGRVQTGQLAAAVHRQLLEGAYESLGGLLGLRATLVRQDDAGLLLLGAPVDERTGLSDALGAAGFDVRPREALLFRRDPVRLVRRDETTVDLRLRTLIVHERALDGRTRVEPLPRPAALQALLGEDPEMVSTLDAEGAGQFVSFVGRLDCCLLTVADTADAVSLVIDVLKQGS
ncbi:MAG TPA: PqqD family peptide modification chaperone [Vicinamibacterales bacterium]|nr:PqqD family peptide modification chaperone [Vicinamibacterales bacterium]